MNRLLIQNVSLFQNEKTLSKNDILIEDRYIKSIDSGNFYPSSQCSEIIDGSRFLAIPGLMNCHTHIPMVLFRGFAEDMNLSDWLTKKIFPLEGKLTEELVYFGALVGIAEMIHSGCTFFADMYFFLEAIAKAVSVSGIRANLSLGLIDQDGDLGLKKSESLFNQYNLSAGERIHIFLGPHAPYTCSLPYLKKISDLAKSLDTGIHIHTNETEKEVFDFIALHHKHPIIALNDLGFFSSPTLCAHCVHMNSDEIEILKEVQAMVVHNPSSNMKLGSGIAPINKMILRGLNVSIGTDGAASNNQLNMFKEMHLTSLLGKTLDKDGSTLSAETVFDMSTKIPGKYLMKGKTGTISTGSLADLILIPLDCHALFPIDFISKSMIHSLQGNEVDTVIIDGKIIMKNQKILTFDEKEIRSKANQLVKETYQ
jgi:5-methylthioadenosine/S-adenosylhomocysteine deaminase